MRPTGSVLILAMFAGVAALSAAAALAEAAASNAAAAEPAADRPMPVLAVPVGPGQGDAVPLSEAGKADEKPPGPQPKGATPPEKAGKPQENAATSRGSAARSEGPATSPEKAATPTREGAAGAGPAKDEEPLISPPPPIPEVEIPPIPEVAGDPFKPGPAPVRVKPPDVVEEGKRLFNREGRIDTDPLGRSVFVFDSGDKPMWLLEGRLREYLETVTDHGQKEARWRISGIVTVYGSQNYLLLTKVVRIMPEEDNL